MHDQEKAVYPKLVEPDPDPLAELARLIGDNPSPLGGGASRGVTHSVGQYTEPPPASSAEQRYDPIGSFVPGYLDIEGLRRTGYARAQDYGLDDYLAEGGGPG